MEDDICQKVYRTRKMVLQNSRIINRIGLGRKGIEVAPYLFKTLDNIYCRTTGSTLEGYMLTEMSYPLLSRQFVSCPNIELITAINHRRSRWKGYDTQSVIQDCSLISCHKVQN